MPRILIVSDVPGEDPETTFAEDVDPALLNDEHAAAGLLERLALGLGHAEEIEERHWLDGRSSSRCAL